MELQKLLGILNEDTRVEIYDRIGNLVYAGLFERYAEMSKRVLWFAPQHNSRGCYLEIEVE